MRTFLLNPPLSPTDRYGGFSEAGAHQPPLGLCYIAAVIRQTHPDVSILDAENLNIGISDAVAAIVEASPDVLGISAVTLNIDNAMEVAREAKKHLPQLKVVLGGVHITALPDETMVRNPWVDYGVIGEGEATIAELLPVLAGGAPPSGVRGICYRDDDGGIQRTAPQEFIADLDSLPMPAWDLLPSLAETYRIPPQSALKLPSFSLVTSRGCPWRCSFCDRATFGTKYRTHSADYVVRMIRDLHTNHGIRSILFEDDVFMVFQARLREVCQMLTEADLDLWWSCMTRVDLFNDKILPSGDLLQLMKDSKCWQVMFGIESGSQRILDRIDKKIRLETVRSAVSGASSEGFYTKGFFIIGHPGETEQTLEDTIGLMRSLPLDDVGISYFTPYPGSPSYPNIDDHGWVDRTYRRMNQFNIVFLPAGFTDDELEAYYRKAWRAFYLRPRIIWRYLARMRNPRQVLELGRGLKAFMRGATLRPRAPLALLREETE